MKYLIFTFCLLLALAVVGCERVKTGYAGEKASEMSDQGKVQPATGKPVNQP